jgi:hypothetical protein
MDVVIVVTGSVQQENFWQNRLNSLQGFLFISPTYVICVHEDWPNGAGNGLGTLYAFLKAREKAKSLLGIDLFKLQENGASIALYHVAGRGQRLYPLTPCEQGSKSLVKLPGWISDSNSPQITILEAILKQTAVYAPYRKGRLSVFWGDQLFFIPSPSEIQVPQSPIDILSKKIAIPARSDWEAAGYDHYGIICRLNNRHFLFEKVSYENFLELIAPAAISEVSEAFLSLGCFSLSWPITQGLLDLFERELKEKKVKMDAEISFWIPLITDQEVFSRMMEQKQFKGSRPQEHYERMQKFKEKFCLQQKQAVPFFSATDIGFNSYWWDFGTLASYFRNTMLLTEKTREGSAMREFLGGDPHSSHKPIGVACDENSLLFNCRIRSGKIKDSILINVEADYIEADHCLIMNSHLHTLEAKNCLLYQVTETETLSMKEGTLRADIDFNKKDITRPHLKTPHLKMYTQLLNDGKADWTVQLPQNPLSYETLHELLQC